MTEAAQQARTPYEMLGGSPVIQRIVDRFYDLMDSEQHYAALRAMHAPELAPMRASLAGWLIAWAGGPRDWHDENPGKCMMTMHRTLNVTSKTADQWVAAMGQAISESGPEDQQLGAMMLERLQDMAQAMASR